MQQKVERVNNKGVGKKMHLKQPFFGTIEYYHFTSAQPCTSQVRHSKTEV